MVGPKTRVDRAKFSPGIELINVSFAPGGAAALLGVGAHEVSGRYVSLEDLGGSSLTGWDGATAEYLGNVPATEKVASIESWLLDRHARRSPRGRGVGLNANVARALNLMDTSGGKISVQGLENELGISRRTLEQLFRDHVGISPKEYARLARVQRAKRMISVVSDGMSNAPYSLGLIAHQCGYHDQSHMTKEFSRVAGLTPAALRSLPIKDGISAFLQDPPEIAI